MAGDIDRIKEKLNIVDFIRGYITLLPAGKNFKALCPFHAEKTPSFIVSPDRQTWHCFGACGEGGDVIKFLMKYENLEFPEALRILAEKAGVPLQTLSAREQREFGVLYDIHEKAKAFYRDVLRGHAGAQAYLKRRGLAPETVEVFELGFAPGGDALTVHLINSGFDVNDVVRAGLAHKNTAGLYRDRFFSRIIFPIANSVGKTVAFTGRLLEGTVGEGSDVPKGTFVETTAPKYLNSPETPIFNKSKILYGFHVTKGDIAKTRTVLFVEGQMDLLMAWQAGVQNTVAVSGTALTPFHMEKLRRLADTVVVSFDNDEAGVRALERALDIFNNYDFYVKVVDLHIYKDPAEAAERDPAFLTQAVAEAQPASSRLFAHYFSSGARRELAEVKRIVKSMLQKIKRLRSAAERSVWLKGLAKHSGISEVMLMQELSELPAAPSGTAAEESPPAREPRKPLDREEAIAERLVGLGFTKPDFLATLLEKRDWFSARHRAILEEPHSEVAAPFQMEASYLAAQSPEDHLAKEFTDLVHQFERCVLEREQREVKVEIQRAEAAGDEASLARAAERFHTLAKRINALK